MWLFCIDWCTKMYIVHFSLNMKAWTLQLIKIINVQVYSQPTPPCSLAAIRNAVTVWQTRKNTNQE